MTPRVRTWLLRLLAALVLLPVLVIAAGQLGAFGGTTPTDLGMKNGRLKAPSATPNSVTSQAALWPGHPMQQVAMIAPLPEPPATGGISATSSPSLSGVDCGANSMLTATCTLRRLAKMSGSAAAR